MKFEELQNDTVSIKIVRSNICLAIYAARVLFQNWKCSKSMRRTLWIEHFNPLTYHISAETIFEILVSYENKNILFS